MSKTAKTARNDSKFKTLITFLMVAAFACAVIFSAALAGCNIDVNTGGAKGGQEHDAPSRGVFFDPGVPTDPAQDGAYFLTRAGWESYIGKGGGDENETWIQSEEDIASDYEFYKEPFAAVVHNNRLTFRNAVYQFSLSNNYYTGQRAGAPVFFSFDGGTLNLRLVGDRSIFGGGECREVDLEFERDASVLFSAEEPRQISAPEGFENTAYSLRWGSADHPGIFLGNRVELRRGGAQGFEPADASSLAWVINGQTGAATFWLSWRYLDLARGTNAVRVTILGGPYYRDGQIYVTTDSEAVTAEVAITRLVTHTLSRPSNFELSGFYLKWRLDDRADGVAIYVKRSDGDFEERYWDFGGGDAIPRPELTSVASLNLGVGVNTVRVIARYPEASFEGGVLTVFKDSSAGEFKITVDSAAQEQLAPYESVSVNGYGLSVGGRAKIYLKRPGEGFKKLNSYWDHGVTFADAPDYGLGENVVRVIAFSNAARLEGGVLTTYTDSEPLDITVIKDAEGKVTVKE